MGRGENDIRGNHAATAKVKLGFIAQGHEPWCVKRLRHLPNEHGGGEEGG